jgi:alpha-tubulin suppressor-like RCC1 family protein
MNPVSPVKKATGVTSFLRVSACLLAILSYARATDYTASYGTAADVPITSAGFDATGHTIEFQLNTTLTTGTSLTVVKNTGLSFITGSFSNLAQGQEVQLSYGGQSYRFVANYYGGSGNDLVLQWANVRAFGWGSNQYLQLGTSSTSSSTVPTPVYAQEHLRGKIILQLVMGGRHGMALCSDGTIHGWGSDAYGQIGQGGGTKSITPAPLKSLGALAGKRVIAIAAGYYHSLALCTDGTVAAWGSNQYGQLGDGSTVSMSSVPVAISTTGVLAGKSVVAIAAGSYHNLALCSDGTVVSWGRSDSGQLGDGTTTFSRVPVNVSTAGVLAGKTVVRVKAGDTMSLVLCSDGSLASWGARAYGQLGDGGATTGISSMPVSVYTVGTLGKRTVTDIAAGQDNAMAVCSDMTIHLWGRSAINNSSSSKAPVFMSQKTFLSGNSLVSISSGGGVNFGVDFSGEAYAWGVQYSPLIYYNYSGYLTPFPCGMRPGDERFIMGARCLGDDSFLALAAYPVGARLTLLDQGTKGYYLRASDSLSLGYLLEGAPLIRSITVSNPGNATLAGLKVTYSGSSAITLLDPLTDSLPAGGSATLRISIIPGITSSPDSSVYFSGALTISGTSQNQTNSYRIGLSGYGVDRKELWRSQYFGTASNSGNAADTATPKNDGIPNLIKFATGMNPTLPGANPGKLLSPSGNVMHFTYPRADDAVASGIIYQVEWSDDLSANSWTSAGVTEISQDQGSTDLVTAQVPRDSSPHRFVRLRVTSP